MSQSEKCLEKTVVINEPKFLCSIQSFHKQEDLLDNHSATSQINVFVTLCPHFQIFCLYVKVCTDPLEITDWMCAEVSFSASNSVESFTSSLMEHIYFNTKEVGIGWVWHYTVRKQSTLFTRQSGNGRGGGGLKYIPKLQRVEMKPCGLGERVAMCSLMFLTFYGWCSFDNLCFVLVYSVISTPGALGCYEFRILVHSHIVFIFGIPGCISTCSHTFKDHKISGA